LLKLAFDRAAAGGGESLLLAPLATPADEILAIYPRTNGMLAFAVFDADGSRREESELIFDTLQRDFVARSGISCFGCHAQGLLPLVDEVRGFVLGSSADWEPSLVASVAALYPPAEQFAAAVVADSAVYESAVSRLGVDLVSSDPISDLALEFDADLTPANVAAELRVSEEWLASEAARLDRRLATGRVTRRDFEAVYGEVNCMATAGALNRPEGCDGP
jgi:hypothetical protein